MLPTLFAALSYQGINGSKNTLPEFYNNAAEIASIIAGGAAAVYAGKDVVDVAVRHPSRGITVEPNLDRVDVGQRGRQPLAHQVGQRLQLRRWLRPSSLRCR